jgi:hypothetical protein
VYGVEHFEAEGEKNGPKRPKDAISILTPLIISVDPLRRKPHLDLIEARVGASDWPGREDHYSSVLPESQGLLSKVNESKQGAGQCRSVIRALVKLVMLTGQSRQLVECLLIG